MLCLLNVFYNAMKATNLSVGAEAAQEGLYARCGREQSSNPNLPVPALLPLLPLPPLKREGSKSRLHLAGLDSSSATHSALLTKAAGRAGGQPP